MRAFRYPVIFLTIGIILLVIAAVVATVYFIRQATTREPAVDELTFTTRQVSSGFTQPTGITAPPDSDQLYVVEQPGTIQRFTPGSQDEPEMFMDISSKVTADGEMGLLGLAFHPDYQQNGYIFVNYIDQNGNTVIARYHTEQNTVQTDSEKILLTLEQPYGNHNGGDLAFGPDGYLYIALGDGGQAGDPDDRAQDKSDLLGKLLRLDINTNEPYIVPSDNPFVGEDGTRPEIWAYGLRNPWRISFDKQTGDLYIADVGQAELEEVNVQPADSQGGENYGWRCFEGTKEYNMEGCDTTESYVPPAIEYDHSDGRCSITGGYVYRGEAYPALQGKYFYGDFCGSQLYYAQQEDSWQQTLALETDFAISVFGQDSQGELYFADYDGGGIYKIEIAS